MRSSRALSMAFIGGVLLGTVGTVAGATLRGSSIFQDVQPGAYYDDAIGDLYSAGIVKGLNDTQFGPNDFITRGQVAVMMQRLRNEILGITPETSSRSSRRTSSSESSSVSSSSRSSSSSSSVASRGPEGAFRFTSTTFSVDENSSTATISIVRVGGAKGLVTVDYSVTPGSATAGTDYEAIAGTLTFADGATSKTLTLTVKDDSTAEGNETVNIELKNPTGGAVVETASAVLTIKDNESGGGTSSSGTSSGNAAGTIEFGATAYTTTEIAGTFAVTVVRTGGSSSSVGISYATANDSAKSGTDYTTTNGTLSFAAGETSKTFTVPILDNDDIDGATKFRVTLTNPTGGASLGTSSVLITILDNDASSFTYGTGSLKFSSATASAEEGTNAEVTVLRAGGAKGIISVKYTTYPSGNVTSADYTTVSGTLTFQDGESTKLIRVPITKDSTSDPGEEFEVRLSEPSTGVQVTSPNTVTVTIEE